MSWLISCLYDEECCECFLGVMQEGIGVFSIWLLDQRENLDEIKYNQDSVIFSNYFFRTSSFFQINLAPLKYCWMFLKVVITEPLFNIQTCRDKISLWKLRFRKVIRPCNDSPLTFCLILPNDVANPNEDWVGGWSGLVSPLNLHLPLTVNPFLRIPMVH